MSFRIPIRARAGIGGRPAVVVALVISLCLVAEAPALAAQVSFTGPIAFVSGGTPFSLAVGDFDGDTDSDLAVANAGSDGVSVLLNDGAGQFGAPTSYVLPNFPSSIVVGDVNGDDDLDLVVANGSGSVSVLLGEAGGSFSAATSFPAGGAPFSVVVDDFDGDADLDIAVANLSFAAPGVSVLLGDGTGHFAFSASFPVPVPSPPFALSAGDFNHDADPDLVTANGDGSVSVLLGQAGGSFGPATTLPAGSFSTPFASRTVAVGDFDEDTHPDLAVANVITDSVWVLLGFGDGTFGPATEFPAGVDGPWALEVDDFDGDAHSDLVVAGFNVGRVSVLLGQGDGRFASFTSFAAGSTPQAVAVGDFDGDVDPDLAVANAPSATSRTVSVLFNITGEAPSLDALSPAHLFVGLKNSDDQGTSFDVRVELLQNGTPVASGLSRCVRGVTRNPAQAKDVVIAWGPFAPVPLNVGDVLSIRVSTRIGTVPNDAACRGHANATGARIYYDAATRQSRFDVTTTAGPSVDLFLHSDGTACNNAPSRGVTNRTLDTTAPDAATAKCQDSTAIRFGGGNLWRVIGTWNLAPQT